ncbi:CP4-57 prophage; RNase LS [Escherichia coli]|nr:CP4-57 prophage; RNase LS [Escherichia coli]
MLNSPPLICLTTVCYFYPELRTIEGVLKSKMSGLGMPVQQPAGFGTYFDKPAAHYILKPQFAATLRPEQINIISTAYTFF